MHKGKNKTLPTTHPTNSPTHYRNLEVRDRDRRCWELRVNERMTLKAIAKLTGFKDHTGVRNAIMRYIAVVDKITINKAEKKLMVDQYLDTIAQVMYEKALKGDIKAAECFRRYLAEKNKLWGMYSNEQKTKQTKFNISVNQNIDMDKMGIKKEFIEAEIVENDNESE